MNKVELIAKYAEMQTISKKEAEEQVENFLNVIEFGLKEDHSVDITKFFRLEIVPTNPRTGRNPQTGEAVEIPAGHKIKCKPLKRLQSIVGK
jgi:DNA-binding protein HU-beta